MDFGGLLQMEHIIIRASCIAEENDPYQQDLWEWRPAEKLAHPDCVPYLGDLIKTMMKLDVETRMLMSFFATKIIMNTFAVHLFHDCFHHH